MNIICYICSGSFKKTSISSHIPVCLANWEEKQMKLPFNQRIKPPHPPKDIMKVVSGNISDKDLEKYNNEALHDWNRRAIVECSFCKR